MLHFDKWTNIRKSALLKYWDFLEIPKKGILWICLVAMYVVSCPTRWSLLFIFGSLVGSSYFTVQATEKYIAAMHYHVYVNFLWFSIVLGIFFRNYESVFVNSLGGYLPKVLVAVEVGGQVSFRKIDVAPSTTNTLWHCHSNNWKTKNARAKYPNLYSFGISMYETLKLPQTGWWSSSFSRKSAGWSTPKY